MELCRSVKYVEKYQTQTCNTMYTGGDTHSSVFGCAIPATLKSITLQRLDSQMTGVIKIIIYYEKEICQKLKGVLITKHTL